MTRARGERIALGAALAASLVVTLGPLAARGSLGIARNDDWDFSVSLFASVDAGHLMVDPWASAMLWGHLLWAWPLVTVVGESRAALQLATSMVGLVALVSLHWLLRQWVPYWVATTVVAVTALGPLFPLLAGSYMTDVPAFALQVLALGAGVRAFTGPRISWAWWAVSLALALAAFTVREYGIAVLAGLVAGLLVRRPARRELIVAGATLAAWVGIAGGLLWLRVSSTPPMWVAEVDTTWPDVVASLAIAGRGLASLSLLALPMLPWIVALLVSEGRSRPTRTWIAAGLAATVVVVGVWFRRYPFVPIQPAYLSNKPAYWNQLDGVAPAWMPTRAWLLVGLLTLLTAGCLAILMSRLVVTRARGGRQPTESKPEPLERRIARATCLGFLIGGTVIVVGLNAVRGFPAMDRYFLPLAPFLLAGVLALPIHRPVLRAVATAGVLALTVAWSSWGLLASDASATNDALRWSVGHELSEQGWSPSTVDAGYEWWGSHQNVPATAAPQRPGATYWTSMFPESPICVQVSYGPAGSRSGEVLMTRSARTLAGTEITVVARVSDPKCGRPAPTPAP